MEWWVILLIVLGSIIGFILLNLVLLFILYITNTDLHLVEKVYNALIKYHDKKHVKTKL